MKTLTQLYNSINTKMIHFIKFILFQEKKVRLLYIGQTYPYPK